MQKSIKILGFVVSLMLFASIPAMIIHAEEPLKGSSDVVINSDNFPDENFRNYISSEFDKDGDGVIHSSEIGSIKEIHCYNIKNLKGIEYFTALTRLDCYSNQLTSLDVSKNTALTRLDCFNNQLTSLDVSGCTALKYLKCSNNQLTSLDVSKNTALTELLCFNNQLSSLDVSKNTALTNFHCKSNQLTSLDVSQNTALENLECGSNQLTSLDVSQNTALKYLECSNNQLTSLDVSQNKTLYWFYCGSNQLTSLDVSQNKTLNWLECGSNQLTSLDVSQNTALDGIYCGSNQLTSLDVSKNKALRVFNCSSNQLTSLDVSQNAVIEMMNCESNQLTSLDLSENSAHLIYLYCGSNQLSSLDLRQNTNLDGIYCESNQLTSLDVSKNKTLRFIDCSSNQLTSLDVSNNSKLNELYCDDNKLTKLDIQNNTYLKDAYKNGKKTVEKTIVKYESSKGIMQCDGKVQVVAEVVPLKITLSSAANGVMISWKEVEGASKYRVYKKNTKGTWVKLATVTTLNYTDTTVKVGETATYSVVGQSSAGKELNTIGNGTKIAYKAPVTTPTAKYKTTGTALSWSAVSGATKYRVFRKLGSGDWTKLTTTTSLSFVDKTAVYGKTYTYAVRAMNAKGSFISDMGKGTSFTYFAPTPKVTLSNGTLGVNMSWATVSGAVKYRIFVKNSSGAWAKLATVKEGTTYTDTTAKVGKSYTYAVVGMDSAGRLMNDYGKGTTIKREKPIFDFTLKSVASGVKISWKAAEGAGKYRVYRKNSDGSWATLATIKDGTLFYRDTTAEDGKTYTYTVAAMSAGGTALTDMGDGQSIKYEKPVSEEEVLEAEVRDADGNVIVYTISGDEITEDYITIIPEDQEEIEETEEDSEEKSEDADGDKSEDTEAASEETEEVSEDTEAVSEDSEEAKEDTVETEVMEKAEEESIIIEEDSEDIGKSGESQDDSLEEEALFEVNKDIPDIMVDSEEIR